MAKLDPRTDSFIALLLDVSGRARPEDVNGVSADEAADLLQQYAAAHPERGVAFDGVMLTFAPASAPSPAPEATSAAEPMPSAELPPVEHAFAPMPLAEPAAAPDTFAEPFAAPPATGAYDPAPASYEASLPVETAAAPSADTELPAWVFEGAPDPAAAPAYPAPAAAPSALDQPPAHEAIFAPAGEPSYAPAPAPAGEPTYAPAPAPDFSPAPAADFAAAPAAFAPDAMQAPTVEPPSDYGVPQAPGPGGYYGVSDAAPPEYAGAAVADFAPAGGYAPQDSSATMDYVMSTPVGPAAVPTRVNGLWWLAVLFFGAPGAFVAWFVNRGRSGSKTFLWVGIVLSVIAIVAFGVAFMLLGSAIFMAAPGGVPAAPVK